jgi:hypothetical protein
MFKKIKTAAVAGAYLYKSVFKAQPGNPLEKFNETNRMVGKVMYLSYLKPAVIRFEKWIKK